MFPDHGPPRFAPPLVDQEKFIAEISSALQQGFKSEVRSGIKLNVSDEASKSGCEPGEAAALAAGRWLGRGDKNGADGAAVDAMRAGDFRVKPSEGKKTCKFCDYSAVCRYDSYRINRKN